MRQFKSMQLTAVVLLALVAGPAVAQHQQHHPKHHPHGAAPYAGMQHRAVKTLSDDQSMGLALTGHQKQHYAKLRGYR